MIIDLLENACCYHHLGERFRAAFRYLTETDLEGAEAGTYEIEGRNVFAMVQEYTTKPLPEGALEAHRRCIDLQYVIRGAELIGYAPVSRLEGGEYDGERDVMFLKGGCDLLTVPAGTFMIMMPQDAHMPCIAAGEPATVKKVVVKIASEPGVV